MNSNNPRADWLRRGALAAVVLLAAACAEKEPATGQPRAVARIDGQAVTEVELDAHLRRLFGEQGLADLPADARRKALESLVMARLIAAKAQAELSADERALVDAQTTLYREQLLVASYLQRHAEPEPVSAAMVEEYYRKHPERFGGGKERSFELIMAVDMPPEIKRNELLQALQGAAQRGDWAALVQELNGKGFNVEYRRGTADDKLLDGRLLSVVTQTPVRQTSAPGLLNRKPFVVRVVDEVDRPPRPLAEVSAEIRRSLAPAQMKEAVRAVAEPLLKEAKVEYLDGGEQNKN